MKTSMYLLLIVLISSCSIFKEVPKVEASEHLTQREMDLLAAIEYIKYDNKECKGDCKIRVCGVFEYFDNCFMVWDSTYFTSLGLDLNIKNSYNPENFYIPDFGTIFFTSPKDSLDYYFSPLIYDKSRNSMLGQVKNKENIRFTYSINVLQDKMYLSSPDVYPANCWGGYGDWY